ncbi:MarR family transcriptional regulator [Streptomyces sp. NPDC094143]|uniref:MarR family winged helix-turn-helix transcriptional regulator n=1 Tax=Streptomyces sp. NPDC094143 TaxID=3155310 RepID=UPI00331B2D77
MFQHLIDAQPTVSDLAAKLDMTQQGASKVVAELERLGYVERLPSPRDARIRHVGLTARGRETVTAARRARDLLRTPGGPAPGPPAHRLGASPPQLRPSRLRTSPSRRGGRRSARCRHRALRWRGRRSRPCPR